MNELLFEIGTEEIPAGYIQPALNFLESTAKKKLQALDLQFNGMRTYGTPRRLTLTIDGLQGKQEDRRQEHIGPAKKAGFDAAGKPTPAALGFARSRGLAPEDLQVVETPKGEYLMAVEEVQGRQTSALLPGLLESLIREMVFPKSMRWADNTMTFGRPIQWLLALYGGNKLDLTIEDISSGTTTLGHRFMAPEPFEISSCQHYVEALGEKYVIVDLEKRRQLVVSEVKKAVKDRVGEQGGEPVLHEGLVDTVTNLVEMPCGICGSFDEKFLQLPEEALVTSMREHQKYFPVAGKDGKLLPLFVAVNNTPIEDRNLAVSGHERVLRARLEDGLFFFNEDRKRKLADRLQDLKGIIFQNKLGTMQEKSARNAGIAAMLAKKVAPELKDDVVRVAQLAKADLLTEMVGEFPSLQGVMGREYSLHDGEKAEVAVAIQEHYMPLRSGGDIPGSLQGALVGIADRVDTLVGCFAIGEKPTGNKDAFGLRRQAIGLINIIHGMSISLSLREVLETAAKGYDGVVEVTEEVIDEILDFIRLRFENEQVALGLPQEVVEAATAVGFYNLTDCMARITALNDIHSQESFTVLAGSFKRIRNIIKGNVATDVDQELLSESAETELFSILAKVRDKALPLIWDRSYDAALHEMLEMKEPVDRFFDEVMVMAEDLTVRQNRLNLLTALGELVLQVGDISKMHVEKD